MKLPDVFRNAIELAGATAQAGREMEVGVGAEMRMER